MKTLHIGKIVSRLAALTAVLAAGFAPALASASTASNATVRNTVYVNYADASAVVQPQISDEVDVLVTLVAATPSLSAPADQTIAPSSTAIYNYTITSNANGPDSYNVTMPFVESGVSSSTVTLNVITSPVLLGATTIVGTPAIAATTDTAITVPADGTSDSVVNGIAATDIVMIGGVQCSVVSVDSDPVVPLTGAVPNAGITVNCASAVSPANASLVTERKSFTITVDPNNYVPPAAATITTDLTARDVANAQPAAVHQTITTIRQILSVVKYVRNVTTGVAGTGTPATVTVDGNTYYDSGVVGAPTQALEYLVEVTNISTIGATDTVISDQVPAFTTFSTAGDCAGSFAVLNNAETVTTADPTPNEVADEGEVVANTVYLYPGSTTHGSDTATGGGNPNGDGGNVAAGLKAYGRFCVTVD